MPEIPLVVDRVDDVDVAVAEPRFAWSPLLPAMGTLMLGLFLSELDQSLFATALPTIVGDLHGASLLLWVNTVYVLTGTLAMPVLGMLGDRVGRRPVFLGALAVLLAGSVVGGLAQDMPTLLAGRAVQGLGGGGLIVLVQAVVADLVPARHRPRAFSGVGAVFAVAALAGPLLGGWLTESVGWRWAFWLNLPVGVVALVVARLRLPRPSPRVNSSGRFDAAGTATLAVALGSATLVASWVGTDRPPPTVLVPVAVLAALATGGFVVVETRVPAPLLPLTLFRDRNVAVAVSGGLVLAVATFGTVGYLPTYLQMAVGLSPTRAGMMMLPLVAGLGMATVGSASVVSRTGAYRALPVVGAAAVAVAFALLAAGDPHTPLVLLGAKLWLLGAGTGCAWEILVVVVQNSVPPECTGVATAANGFTREIGVLLGGAAVGAVFTARLASGLGETAAGLGLPDAALTPEAMAALPAHLSAVVSTAYSNAITPVFAALVPLVAAAAASLLFVRPVPLGTQVPPLESVDR